MSQKGKGNKTLFTVGEFNKIKKLHAHGLSIKDIIDIVERSDATIYRVIHSPQWADYREKVITTSGIALKTARREAAAEPTPTPAPEVAPIDHPTPVVLDKKDEVLRVENEDLSGLHYIAVALNRIADSQERLAVAWESKPKKGLLGGR